MLIVAGGTEDGKTSLDSTELFIKNKWTPGESLPHALRGLRGYSLDGYFYIFGTNIYNPAHNFSGINQRSFLGGMDNNDNAKKEILKYYNDKWIEFGNMSVSRHNHAVSIVSPEDITEFCSAINQ